MPVKGKKTVGTKRQEMAHKADHLSKSKHCHFSKQEVERLLQLFKEFTKNSSNEGKRGKGLDRSTFRDILHQHFDMTDDVLMDKVFKAFDGDNDGVINEDEWVKGMSIFLKGTIEEQAKYCFGVYTAQRGEDGYINRDEIFMLLKSSLVQQSTEEDPDEMPKELVELSLKLLDFDRDGRISVTDYIAAVQKEKLLIEALGHCLPNQHCKDCFLELVQDDKQKQKF